MASLSPSATQTATATDGGWPRMSTYQSDFKAPSRWSLLTDAEEDEWLDIVPPLLSPNCKCSECVEEEVTSHILTLQEYQKALRCSLDEQKHCLVRVSKRKMTADAYCGRVHARQYLPGEAGTIVTADAMYDTATRHAALLSDGVRVRVYNALLDTHTLAKRLIVMLKLEHSVVRCGHNKE